MSWSKLSLYLLYSLFGLAILHACYIAILGGTAIFFWLDLSLIVVYQLQLKQSMLRSCSLLILPICLLLSLYLHLSFIGLLLPHLSLSAYYFSRRSKQLTECQHLLLASLLSICLLIFLSVQITYLQQLQQHYASFHTDESWQQLGAL
ncbi:hypothetical protein [Acinetobacter sp. ANC 4641]|uniref:hypothetical protein n=1 Tax=Acinetobacter sp. ANC 4641 TaxID=2529847 RepID=UPI0010395E4B|nr:hypothetical protein [Acinetobacter sp. ANC 4641]TCB13319.1 hypothetical protein E0H78_01535 [Acinetobacter sp. ANC 4641]